MGFVKYFLKLASGRTLKKEEMKNAHRYVNIHTPCGCTTCRHKHPDKLWCCKYGEAIEQDGSCDEWEVRINVG